MEKENTVNIQLNEKDVREIVKDHIAELQGVVSADFPHDLHTFDLDTSEHLCNIQEKVTKILLSLDEKKKPIIIYQVDANKGQLKVWTIKVKED